MKLSIAYYKKAIEAVENEPSLIIYHAVYLQNLGLAYADTGDTDAAEKAYVQSLDLEPENAENLNNAGVFYYKIANWTNALNMFQQALKLDQKNPLYYRNMADTYFNMGDTKNAGAMNEKANELENQVGKDKRVNFYAFFFIGNATTLYSQSHTFPKHTNEINKRIVVFIHNLKALFTC